MRVVAMLAVLGAAFGGQAMAGDAKQAELTRTMSALDQALFDAYNTCDLAKLDAMVADDLEFYHDQGGLMRGRAPFIAAIKANVCGKTRRELVAASVEVYPLKGYGAVQTGVHTFCQTDAKGACKSPKGPAKFVHVWRELDGRWVLARVISYDHH